jgi:hypothetical protein
LILRLTSSVNGVGVESVGISVADGSRAGKTSGSAVTVAVILGTGAVNGRCVSLLVQGSGGLVLLVALAGKSGEVAEEEGAVSDVVVGGEGVGEHARRAAAVDVSAVSTGLAAGSGATVGSDGSQACGNSAAHAGRGSLEVLLELAGGARGGSSGGSGGQSLAVAEGRTNSSETSARAVTLDGGALGELADSALDLGCLSGIDVNRKSVAVEGKGTSGQSGGVELSVGNGTSSGDIVLAAGGELVQLGKFDLDLNRLAGHDGLENILAKRLVSQTLQDTSELSLGICIISSTFIFC